MTDTPARPRLFLSHRSSHKPTLHRLEAALANHGIDVWLDEEEIAPFDEIREEARQGVLDSHGLLAWWYPGDDGVAYAEAPACQYELITALACCQAEGLFQLSRRVFWAGPAGARDDLAVGRLKGALLPPLPDDPAKIDDAALAKLAQDIAKRLHAEALKPFGAAEAAANDATAAWMAEPPADFTGRGAELLRLHALTWGAGPGHEGDGPVVALISGIGGEGKTMLATRYAALFRSTWPGGVFLLSLGGDASDAQLRDATSARSTLGGIDHPPPRL